ISTRAAMPDRFRRDPHARDMLADTLMIDQIFASDFEAMIGVSTMDGLWDLVENDSAARVVDELFALGRPVALVGHAAAMLCHSPSPVAPVRGRGVTGASSEEDHIACPGMQLPLHVESRLQAMESHYTSGPPWQSFLIEHDNLITGQNMASVDAAVNALMRLL